MEQESRSANTSHAQSNPGRMGTMCCANNTASRFLQKYYVLNVLVVASYFLIRIFGARAAIAGLTSAEGLDWLATGGGNCRFRFRC